VSQGIDAGGAPRPVGAYPHARRVGDLLLMSGIGPRDPATNAVPGNRHDASGKLVGHDIAAQTRAVFANVRAVLEASGARWEDLVDVTVFLTDMANDFTAYNAVWAEYFPDLRPHRAAPRSASTRCPRRSPSNSSASPPSRSKPCCPPR